MEREQEENARFELDNQFGELRDLLFTAAASVSAPTPADTTEEPSIEDPDAALLALAPETQDTEYDQRVRELAFDKRAKPKDRTKTEEELALDSKEALEKAEKRRQRRMQGLEESGGEEEGHGKGKRKRGGDDLDDDFFEDGDDEWLGAGLQTRPAAAAADGSEDEESEGSEQEDEDSDDEVEGDSLGEEAVESSDEESVAEEDEGEEGEHESLAPSRLKKAKGKQKVRSGGADEIPYTFPCPENHDDFLEIMEGIDERHISTVVQRIRALYHTSLSADNKRKLQVRCLAVFMCRS